MRTVSETLREITARPAATGTQSAEFNIRWVLAHDPPVVFEDASREFAETVREKTNGDVAIHLYGTEELVAGRGGDTISRTELVECLVRGEIEMAHTYMSALGSVHDKLWAIELPFMFRDYAHADRVFEGPIARRYMDELVPKGIRGLAFAYSGGYRILPSRGRAIRSIDDFAGLTVRTSGNPVASAFFERLGAKAIAGPLEKIARWADEGSIDAAELTYVRFLPTGLERTFDIVNETNHSIFTTMMVINEDYFQRLPEKHQAVLADAGREAGKVERMKALVEEEKVKAACPDKGVEIVRMSDDDLAKVREAALAVYEQFTPKFGEQLIGDLQSA